MVLALSAAVAFGLSGGALGRPRAFTARSNSFCADAWATITTLVGPSDPKRQIRYATDRYTAIEHAVSALTDSTLPSGATGQALRAHWLRPARASLLAGRAPLQNLRVAVNRADTTGSAALTLTTAAFAPTQSIGTQGVDLALLRRSGLNQCARLFTPGRS